jgi:CRP/FNR family transcriptional regulator, cyclic AMP receptor protein
MYSMKQNGKLPCDPEFLTVAGRALLEYNKAQAIFAQGDPADAVFCIESGKIKLTVVSARGKEAIVGILGTHDFFGEGCLAGQLLRMATATAMIDCAILRVEKQDAIRAIRENPGFAAIFVAHLLSRNIRIEEDLVDHLFNSSEMRLARVLLLLANFGKDAEPDKVIPKVSQETLAEMVGTTRSRVSYFMNKFRKLGFINYDSGLEVHRSLLNFVLHDSSSTKSQNQVLEPLSR